MLGSTFRAARTMYSPKTPGRATVEEEGADASPLGAADVGADGALVAERVDVPANADAAGIDEGAVSAIRTSSQSTAGRGRSLGCALDDTKRSCALQRGRSRDSSVTSPLRQAQGKPRVPSQRERGL
jgi:hypothetical protein